ncbi:hypothetical protein [Agreia sp. VKM Ac-1783]|uniref:hypothetical protein n=1 Tax=Agreia sp. VKM Ac-1783 TaxID=1938889 RepID=UPI000A2AC7F9|nr:hypothetical protein [Agreia sp. VKM Ac-1783]SMQ58084.1 hypothetical protein SAMN06295943_0112 [Agreia sp. VKM Ac-1783]
MTVVSTTDERALVRRLLVDHSVAGAEDFGRFVNDRRYFDTSSFDSKAATPVLIEALPFLTDPGVIETVALHLKNPAARPAAFGALHTAFLEWGAVRRGRVGWQLGEALVNAAPIRETSLVLAIATDSAYGTNRQPVVLGLPRFRRAPETERALRELVHDIDVAQQAMYSLRRVVGPQLTVDALEDVRSAHPDSTLERLARHEIRKINRTLRRHDAETAAAVAAAVALPVTDSLAPADDAPPLDAITV